MDPVTIIGIVTGTIGLINQLVPIIGNLSGATPGTVAPVINNSLDLIGKLVPLIGVKDGSAVDQIIKTLKEMAPLIVDQGTVTYTAVKNIIASLRETPATKQEQLAALDALDKQVDDAWNAIESRLDPDK